MTSNDINTTTIQLRELIAVNKEQIAEIKALAAQMQRDNAEFHALMIKAFSDFTEKQDAKFEAFTEKQDAKFEAFINKIEGFSKELRQDMKELRAEVAIIQRDVEGLKHDVASLFHWDYWLLTLIIAAIVFPHLADVIKSITDALARTFSAVASLFRKGKNYDA